MLSIRRGQWNADWPRHDQCAVMLKIMLPQAAMRVLPALALDLGLALQGWRWFP
jgi:hypothetical protein